MIDDIIRVFTQANGRQRRIRFIHNSTFHPSRTGVPVSMVHDPTPEDVDTGEQLTFVSLDIIRDADGNNLRAESDPSD